MESIKVVFSTQEIESLGRHYAVLEKRMVSNYMGSSESQGISLNIVILFAESLFLSYNLNQHTTYSKKTIILQNIEDLMEL